MQTHIPFSGGRMGRRIAGLAMAGLLWAAGAPAQVVINELMADNRGSVVNGADVPDWVELHNPSTQSVNLAGMSLSDDPLLPRQFVFPANTILPPRGYLVVWCSTNAAVTGLRAPFGLGSKTDRVLLYAANGVTLVDQVYYGLQAPDLSLGRIPNGAGAWTLNEPTPEGVNQVQALAAADQLRINEWLAMPGTGNDDWLELYNAAPLPVALTGLVVTDRPSGTPTNRAIPALSFIAGHGFVQLFASDLNENDADHLDFKLGSSGEVITLYAANRSTLLDRVIFGQQTSLTSQGRAPDGGANIVSFQPAFVTPGAANFALMTSVVISEVLTHADPPLEDAIELHNTSDQPVSIGYWWLSDSASNPKKFMIPAGTVIPARGFAMFYAYQFGPGANGFLLDSAEGDEVYLSVGDSAGNLNGQQTFVTFGAMKNGVSVGRHRTSTGVDFVPLGHRTFGVDNPGSLPHFRSGAGLSNAAARVGPVVINEILYQMPAGGMDVEYLELHNPGAQAVPLYDPNYPTNYWRLRDGITFRFPPATGIPAGGYLLLVNFDPAADPAQAAAFRQTFQVPAAVPVLGPFEGRLSDSGETLQMLWPDTPQGPDSAEPGFVPYELVERIRYGTGGAWPALAATGPQSLQRHSATAYGNEPLNWFAAAPTAGRANVANADTDGDGLPDAWEEEHGLDRDLAGDAQEDLDGDGASNLEEYLMGTDPLEPASVFKLMLQRPVGGNWTLEFDVVAGREYQIERCLQLGGAWQVFTNLAGITEPGRRQIAISADSSPGFFRLAGNLAP